MEIYKRIDKHSNGTEQSPEIWEFFVRSTHFLPCKSNTSLKKSYQLKKMFDYSFFEPPFPGNPFFKSLNNWVCHLISATLSHHTPTLWLPLDFQLIPSSTQISISFDPLWDLIAALFHCHLSLMSSLSFLNFHG